MNSYNFTLEYTSPKREIDKEKYFEEEGSLAFDTHSLEETKIMMQAISSGLSIKDEYSLKKLEVLLRYDLPFFATNRRLVRNWLMENFIF
jgi:hypothetical protein